MKNLLCLLMVCLSFTALAQTSNNTNKEKYSTTKRAISNEGEKVWVIINQVKSDKQAQFEKFVTENFWPMAAKLSQKDQQVFKQTRVLYPTKAEEDGSYVYVFLMDPYIEGGDYDILNLLKKMYGEPKAIELNKQFEETLVKEQTQYMLTQSKY